VLLVQEEADLLQDRLGVGGEHGMLADRDQRLVELGRVREVEVPAQGQVARGQGLRLKYGWQALRL
jgi:hypothetical protein